MRSFLEVWDMFITLIVVMVVSWVHAYVQTHHKVYVKYVHFFVYYIDLKKVGKKKKC